MPYKLNKIIFERDHTWGYESYTYDLKTEIEFPFAFILCELESNKENTD